MASIGKIARRTFLFGAAAIAGGAAFGYYYYRSPYANPLEGELAEGETTFNPFVKIASDNTITVIAPRAEMGQGISTTLAALVAEELEVDLDRIKVEHGPADFAYFNATMLAEGGPFAFYNEGTSAEAMRGVMGAVGKMFGVQGTGGSASTRDGYREDARGGRRDAPGADRRCRGAARRAGRRPRRRKRLGPAQGVGKVGHLWRGRRRCGKARNAVGREAQGQGRLEDPRQAAGAQGHARQGHRRADLRRRRHACPTCSTARSG